MLKVRKGGGEELPLVQGKEQQLHFAGAAVMKRPKQQDSHRFCLPLKGSKMPSPLLCCLGGHQGAIRVPFPFPS